jgi:hypothetical protein
MEESECDRVNERVGLSGSQVKGCPSSHHHLFHSWHCCWYCWCCCWCREVRCFCCLQLLSLSASLPLPGLVVTVRKPRERIAISGRQGNFSFICGIYESQESDYDVSCRERETERQKQRQIERQTDPSFAASMSHKKATMM